MIRVSRRLGTACLLLLLLHAMARADRGEPARDALSAPTRARGQAAIDRALSYLRSTQRKDGGWSTENGPAVTAIVGRAFVQDKAYGPAHVIVGRAVAGILQFAQPDGGVYERHRNLANYQTSVVLMLFASIESPELRPRIARAQAFLTQLQYDDGEKVDAKDGWYGGAGYNSRKRPDLSNTQMMLEALHRSGLPRTDPVYQKALAFVSRCQMNGATNDQRFARGSTDGGFVYSTDGTSKANEGLLEGLGTPRSYGSMTYAGFKSMLYADVKRDDPRLLACLQWIRSHYSLDENPNLPGRRSREGLYYYYHVFARALAAWGEPVLIDARGVGHNWRDELIHKLVSLQKADGSWVNDRSRWMEGDCDYVTGLTALTLQTAMERGPDEPPL